MGKWLLPLYSALALIFLLTPIVYTFVFSFNASVKSNIVWVGFTLDNWLNVCDAQGVCAAFGTSILVGIVATVIATILGTLLAIA
ncbi:MAG: ABC transporter permease, partial [Rhodoglobus sp.]|nr:ABC transporter permease [Rhodoglobus sp.]